MIRLRTNILILMAALATAGIAADTIPLDPQSPQAVAGERLEVERIELQKDGTMPSTLHRKPGRFILLVDNRNESKQNATFILDSATTGDLIVGPNPLLRFGSLASSDRKHRSATVVNAPAGEFDLKYSDTGKIVCHFTIDAQ